MKDALTELLPRKARLVLYVIASIVLLALTVWQAAEGNISAAIVSFLTTFAPVLAAGNVTPPTPEEP